MGSKSLSVYLAESLEVLGLILLGLLDHLNVKCLLYFGGPASQWWHNTMAWESLLLLLDVLCLQSCLDCFHIEQVICCGFSCLKLL